MGSGLGATASLCLLEDTPLPVGHWRQEKLKGLAQAYACSAGVWYINQVPFPYGVAEEKAVTVFHLHALGLPNIVRATRIPAGGEPPL